MNETVNWNWNVFLTIPNYERNHLNKANNVSVIIFYFLALFEFNLNAVKINIPGNLQQNTCQSSDRCRSYWKHCLYFNAFDIGRITARNMILGYQHIFFSLSHARVMLIILSLWHLSTSLKFTIYFIYHLLWAYSYKTQPSIQGEVIWLTILLLPQYYCI